MSIKKNEMVLYYTWSVVTYMGTIIVITKEHSFTKAEENFRKYFWKKDVFIEKIDFIGMVYGLDEMFN